MARLGCAVRRVGYGGRFLASYDRNVAIDQQSRLQEAAAQAHSAQDRRRSCGSE